MNNLLRKSAFLQIRLEPNLKATIERAAKDDHRTVTSLIEKLVTDYLKQHGYLPSSGKPAGKRK
jgi:hypothetical protein